MLAQAEAAALNPGQANDAPKSPETTASNDSADAANPEISKLRLAYDAAGYYIGSAASTLYNSSLVRDTTNAVLGLGLGAAAVKYVPSIYAMVRK